MTLVKAAPSGVQAGAIVMTKDFGSVDPGALLFGKLDQPAEPVGLDDDVIVQQIEIVRSLASAATSVDRFLAFKNRSVEGSGVAPILIQSEDPDRRGDESQ